jgi:hypothetical protein
MTDITSILARSFIILFFKLSIDDSYNKLLYELLSFFGCCFSSLTTVLFLFFFTFTTSTSSAESESLDDAS